MKIKIYFALKKNIFLKKLHNKRIYLPEFDKKDAFANLKASKFVLSLHLKVLNKHIKHL
jgi:hypothetical protein